MSVMLGEDRDVGLLLREKLKQIADIEKANNFLGVRFSLRAAAHNSEISTEDVAQHVLDVLEETVSLSGEKHAISFSEPYPPELDTPSEFRDNISLKLNL